MNIIIVTKMGQIIKFHSDQAPNQKKGGMGTKAISLREGDEVVGIASE